jgi:hypothetical protein
MKAGLHFPLHKMLVEVLKTFEIYLHQHTPEAFIKVGFFIWAMRSQGLEPDAKCFCNIHELSCANILEEVVGFLDVAMVLCEE